MRKNCSAHNTYTSKFDLCQKWTQFFQFFHQAYRKATSSQELDEKMNQLHSSVERMKTSSWSGDFPPLVDLANSLSRFIDKTKVWLKKQDDSFAATVKENEKELENLKNVLQFLEEQNDEL